MLSSLRGALSKALPRHVARRAVASAPSFLPTRSMSGVSFMDDDPEVYKEATQALGLNTPYHPPPREVELEKFTEESEDSEVEEFEDDDIAQQRVPVPLPRDPLLDYFTAALLRHGHRTRAQNLVTQTLLNIHTLTRAEALPILREAILIASPAVKVLNHKTRAGKPEPKPFALNDRQRAKLAFRWILKETAKRKGPLPDRLAKEIISIIVGKSGVLKAKAELHRSAMLSRSFLKGY